MSLEAFWKGFYLAFYVVVPIGAVSIICIKKTLQRGVTVGFVSSLGIITAESIYAIVAICGITLVSEFLLEWKFHLQLIGFALMTIIGVRIATSKISKIDNSQTKEKGLLNDYFSMALITLINPLTLFGFAAVFTSFGAHEMSNDFLTQAAMLLGFFVMTLLYNLVLIFSSTALKIKIISKNSRISNDLQLINMLHQISGVVIIFFSVITLLFSLTKN